MYDPKVHQFRRVNLFVARLVEVDNMFTSIPNGWIRIDRLYIPLWSGHTPDSLPVRL